jgi:hypothetical protein
MGWWVVQAAHRWKRGRPQAWSDHLYQGVFLVRLRGTLGVRLFGQWAWILLHVQHHGQRDVGRWHRGQYQRPAAQEVLVFEGTLSKVLVEVIRDSFGLASLIEVYQVALVLAEELVKLADVIHGLVRVSCC